jgi:hypothetical protein
MYFDSVLRVILSGTASALLRLVMVAPVPLRIRESLNSGIKHQLMTPELPLPPAHTFTIWLHGNSNGVSTWYRSFQAPLSKLATMRCTHWRQLERLMQHINVQCYKFCHRTSHPCEFASRRERKSARIGRLKPANRPQVARAHIAVADIAEGVGIGLTATAVGGACFHRWVSWKQRTLLRQPLALVFHAASAAHTATAS